MAYQPIYRIPVKSILGTLWTADIEKDGYTGSVIEMTGDASPIIIDYRDADEGKIAPIRASVCTISFVSEIFDFESIIDDNDTVYRLTVNDPNGVQWRGLISTDDCSEEYTSGPRRFKLTANDGLATLKDEPYKWQDGTDGKDAYGKRLLLNILADCLQYTYTELEILIECNLYESGTVTFDHDDPFFLTKAHTKLFLYVNGGPKNMYEVLECLMLTFDCTIFQQFGQWHVKRMPDNIYTLSLDNTLYAWPDLSRSQILQDWSVLRPTNIIPVNANHLLAYTKANKFSKIQHNYLIPETPTNESMTRGELITSSSTERTYYIDDWSYQSGAVSSPTIAAFGTAYRKETFDVEGNLDESYIVAPDQGTNDERLINDEVVFVEAGDRVAVSAETRLLNDLGGAGNGVALRLVLYGDSGQKYTYDETTSTWIATAASAIGSSAYTRTFGGGDNLENWFPFSVQDTTSPVTDNTAPFPEGGGLSIWFSDWSTGSNESWFRNIRIDIKLFLNQVTANFTGEESTSDNNLTSRQSDERIIRLGDAPKRVIASALWRWSDDTVLTHGWGRLGEAQTSRLIDLNSQDLQNMSYRVFKRLEGDFKGVTFDGGKLIGVGNLFSIDGLIWVATNMQIDIINDTFSVTLQEFSDETKSLPTLETEFKYLFNERS